MKLIVGLGNPGEKYAKVRHNLGFSVIDELAKKFGVRSSWFVDKKFKSEIVNCQLPASRGEPTTNYKLVLAKPMTYMNNSGMALSVLSSEFGVRSEDIIVIHDELDLPLGKIKIRLGGAAAGHHGVESIIEAIGDKFIRVRLGIGNLKTQSSEHKHAHIDVEKYVLEPFTHSEKSTVKHMLKQALKAVETLLEKGVLEAQNQYN